MSMNLIEVEEGPRSWIFLLRGLRGYFNLDAGASLAQELDRFLISSAQGVVVDFAFIELLNSHGATFLWETLERVSEIDKRIVFCSCSAGILRNLKIIGMDREVSVFPDRQSAISDLC
jgi:anti-anti-sigma regulatory factor